MELRTDIMSRLARDVFDRKHFETEPNFWLGPGVQVKKRSG